MRVALIEVRTDVKTRIPGELANGGVGLTVHLHGRFLAPLGRALTGWKPGQEIFRQADEFEAWAMEREGREELPPDARQRGAHDLPCVVAGRAAVHRRAFGLQSQRLVEFHGPPLARAPLRRN